MAFATFSQRVAHNYHQNTVPWPSAMTSDDLRAEGHALEVLLSGLQAFHGFLCGLYALARRSPEAFHLPLSADVEPRSGRAYDQARQKLARLPNVLYGIGCLGGLEGDDAALRLLVPCEQLMDHCKAIRVTGLAKLLSDFGAAGMVCAEADGLVSVRFPAAPETAVGVSALARAARSVARDPRHAPDAFCRADMRVMFTSVRGAKPPEITLDDVAQPLAQEHAQALRLLVGCVEELGYRPQLKCSGLARGEWRGSYANRRLGRTLLGLVVEEQVLQVRINFDTDETILPAADRLPPGLREQFLHAAECRGCGRCQEGPTETTVDGKPFALCRGFSLHLTGPTPADAEQLKALVLAQDRILRTST